jgi:putative hydrolase of the HAD superfamily
MFRIALQRAGLAAEAVWFCGDSAAADVCGAHGAGMFPVLYEGEAEDGERSPYLEANRQILLDFDHLHIRHWRELGQLLREL